MIRALKIPVAIFLVFVLYAISLRADGPVPDSVPRPPAEPAPEIWRFKADLSSPMTGDYDVRLATRGFPDSPQAAT